MSTAIVLTPQGEIREVNLPTTGSSLDVMYREIGCRSVDVVRLTSRLDMWLDDEGIYTQEINPFATALARHHGYTYQPYFGTVLLCSVTDEGDSIDLTVDQVRALLAHLLDVV
ncbi:DUF3846 domain-containing protein [Nonomuraea sp. NPDC050202]|uniref:DUF3846 domain-containing protein n=1 Tax=Nonomuraea sp. NPDC050202 TaxID=3155035 RepID=UPI0033E5BDBC